MLEIPDNIKELFRADNLDSSTMKNFKLNFYSDEIDTLYPYETLYPEEELFPAESGAAWLTIENDRIESESMTISESLSESDDLDFGSCEAACIEITVADIIDDLIGKEFTLTLEIGGYSMAMGIYTVTSFVRQSDRRKRKITAYDRMMLFDVDVSTWYNDLTFPMTVKEFRDALCDYIGVEQEDKTLPLDSMSVEKTIEPTTISGRDVLKAICEINGCFGHMTKMGTLNYIQLQQTGLYPSETLYPSDDELYPSEYGGDGIPIEVVDHYKQPITYEDYLVEGITGLTIREEEGDVGASVGDGTNAYVIEGNFLAYGKSAADLLSIAQTILPEIQGRTYRPAEIECNAMPWIEVGDAVRAVTNDDIVETFVMKRTTSGCQAMMDTIEATGDQLRNGDFGIESEIIQLQGKSAVITKNVEEVSATLTDLANYTESQFKITADSITAEVTRATAAEGTLQSQITINADAITLKVSKGDVTSQLNSELTITGNSIALTTGHFTVDSKNLTIDSAGNATFSGALSAASGTFNGAITGGSITIGSYFSVDSSGNMTATSGRIGGFTISDNKLTARSSSAEIDWGDFYIDGSGAYIGGWIFNEGDGAVGPVISGSGQAQTWDADGNIYCTELYVANSWWKDWSLTETVETLWNYVYYGGWCKSDSTCSADSTCSGHCSDASCERQDGCIGGDETCGCEIACSEQGSCTCVGGYCDDCDDCDDCTCDGHGSGCSCDDEACGPGYG